MSLEILNSDYNSGPIPRMWLYYSHDKSFCCSNHAHLAKYDPEPAVRVDTQPERCHRTHLEVPLSQSELVEDADRGEVAITLPRKNFYSGIVELVGYVFYVPTAEDVTENNITAEANSLQEIGDKHQKC